MDKHKLKQLLMAINISLSEGKSLKALLKKYGVQKKDFSKIGYTYNANAKQFLNDTEGQSAGLKAGQEKQEIELLEELSIDVMQSCGDVGRINPKDYINDNLEVLMEMIKTFKESNFINSNNMIVQLPMENDKNFKASIRVNDVIWTQFKDFCKEHKQFTQKELISQALLDYMTRNNK